MIKLEHVNKYFYRHKRNEIHVIDDTSFTLPESGLVALLGPSGCGKTTLLNAIGGLDKVHSGNIYIDGKRITKRSQRYIDKIRNGEIGYIFQDYHLINNMSVFDNVAISLRMIGIKDKKEIKEKVNYILETIGLYRYRKRPAGMLSGGERQRVGIARAIVKDPKIIIADEPTGNLDSANSIEIMNIIKSISKNRLVLLVTHETGLANFYADRIMTISDGKVIEDKPNTPGENLDYRLDNKIYLKDFKNIDKFEKNNSNISIYSDTDRKLDLTIIVQNHNIYIQSKNKVEVLEADSKIEVIDDHEKKIDKTIYEEYVFNQEALARKQKARYSSIINLWHSITGGFQKLFEYPFVKKLLLLGFLASAMFITYSVCNIFGVLKIEDKDFITANRNYLYAKSVNYKVEDYLELEKMEGVDYLIPEDCYVNLLLNDLFYYQTNRTSLVFQGALVSLDYLDESTLIYGRMPQNKNEIVIDELVLLKHFDQDNGETKMVGFGHVEDYLNQYLYGTDGFKLKVVGISHNTEPSIYVDPSIMVTTLYYGYNDGDGFYGDESSNRLYDMNLFNIELAKGRMPENDYEIVISEEYQYFYPLNKVIDEKINGHALKVVGYYKNKEFKNYITTSNTIKLALIGDNNRNIIIMPKDSELVIQNLQQKGIGAVSLYEFNKNSYLSDKAQMISSGVIAAVVMLVISFVEIYLMIRSSFLSRIKEVGILRAIGVKKWDIYKMFVGEIMAISTLACVPGCLFMAYCLNAFADVSYIASNYVVNYFTVTLSIIIIYLFNIISGLLPIIFVVSETPAKILARKDLD